tara:strand:+ start:5448 stop:5762 length:315 start_codon:yes stop_codon:yes gene_type:complete
MQAQYDEIEVLEKTFLSLFDSESRVDNIRRRISLLKQRIGYTDKPIYEPQVKKAPERSTQEHADEMAKLRAKMQPKAKTTVETETEVADKELRDAINKAMAKMK